MSDNEANHKMVCYLVLNIYLPKIELASMPFPSIQHESDSYNNDAHGDQNHRYYGFARAFGLFFSGCIYRMELYRSSFFSGKSLQFDFVVIKLLN